MDDRRLVLPPAPLGCMAGRLLHRRGDGPARLRPRMATAHHDRDRLSAGAALLITARAGRGQRAANPSIEQASIRGYPVKTKTVLTVLLIVALVSVLDGSVAPVAAN